MEEPQSKQSEGLVPYDASFKAESDIRDKDIKDILKEATSHNITLIFDCCHSAGATRRGEDTVLSLLSFSIRVFQSISECRQL